MKFSKGIIFLKAKHFETYWQYLIFKILDYFISFIIFDANCLFLFSDLVVIAKCYMT